MMKKYLLLIFVFFILKNTTIAQEVIEVVEDTEEVEETVIESTETDNVNSLYGRSNSTDIVIGEIDNTLLIFKGKNSNKYGLKNKNNKILVNPIFDKIYKYESTKNRIIASINNKNGVIDSKGNIIIPFECNDIDFRENIIVAYTNKKRVVFDFFGNILIDNEYNYIDSLENGFFRVKKNGYYGILSPTGEEIFPIEYEDIYYNGRWFKLKKNGIITYKYHNGQYVFDKEYSNIVPVDNLFKAKKGKKYGLINRYGKIILPFKFEDIGDKYFDNNYIVKINDKWGIYNLLLGNLIEKADYNEIKWISGYLYLVKKNNQKILLNLISKKKIDCSNYTWVYPYINNNLLRVEESNLKGALDLTSGKLVIPTKYYDLEYFNHIIKSKISANSYDLYTLKGRSLVKDISDTKYLTKDKLTFSGKGKVGLIENDKIVLPLEYDFISYYRYFRVVLVKKDNKYALLNNYNYNYLIPFSDNKIIVDKDDKIIIYKNKKYTVALGKLIEIKK